MAIQIEHISGLICHLALFIRHAQRRIGHGGGARPKRRIAPIVEDAVGQVKSTDEVPHVAICPIQYWIDAHELGPALVRIGQCKIVNIFAMGIVNSRAHEYCFYFGMICFDLTLILL